jgi:hypothetical protein
MNRRLEEDLERWEAGLAQAAELEERHPGPDVHEIMELHTQLKALGREATPDPEPGWHRLSARLPEREPASVLTEPSHSRHRLRRRVAVVGLAAALMLTGGLAAADVLPGPAQDAVANLAGHLGLHLPHSPEVPDDATHGKEVSDVARSTPKEGCEKGQAVSEVASSVGQDHRLGDPQPSPCDEVQAAGGSHQSAQGAGKGKGPGAGAAHAPDDPGLEHRGDHGPPGS